LEQVIERLGYQLVHGASGRTRDLQAVRISLGRWAEIGAVPAWFRTWGAFASSDKAQIIYLERWTLRCLGFSFHPPFDAACRAWLLLEFRLVSRRSSGLTRFLIGLPASTNCSRPGAGREARLSPSVI
jgi:hypothetical protein